MKNQYKIFVFLLVLVGMFSSCSEDKEIKKITDPNELDATSITAPISGDSFVLTMDQKDEVAMVVRWDKPDFGVDVKIDFSVDIDVKGGDFSNPTNLAITNYDTLAITQEELNTKLLALGLPTDESNEIDIRVLSVVNYQVDEYFSEVTTVSVTPYETIINYPMIYVPGEYQGWSPGAENGRLYSYDFDNIYKGIIRITDGSGAFKITTAASWDLAYGGTLTADGDNYSGTLDASGGDFVVTPGTYAFVVDQDAMTIMLTKTDYWGIIGDAVGGWGDTDDIIMQYNGQLKRWETTADFVTGGWKFRKNSSWGGDLTGDADGNLVSSGENISCDVAGTYFVAFDLDNMSYVFELAE